MMSHRKIFNFFFFNDTATTEIYTLSLHDALPILIQTGLPVPEGFVVTTKIYKNFSSKQFSKELSKEIMRSEEHTSELQSLTNLVCRLLLEKKKKIDCLTSSHVVRDS